MDIDGILKSIEGWALAERIRQGLYLFPMLESIHVVGLAIVFGTILILDLRLMGKASMSRNFQTMAPEIVKWTWVGFAITVITGALMFTTNATVYSHNTWFQIKMLLLLLAGINMAAFELTLGRRSGEWATATVTPPRARMAARASVVIWILVILTGRLIGFTTSRVATEAPPPADVDFENIFE